MCPISTEPASRSSSSALVSPARWRHADMTPATADGRATADRRFTVTGLAVVTLVLGVLALATPLGRAEFPAARVGGWLYLAACIEMLHALRRSTLAARRRAAIGAV